MKPIIFLTILFFPTLTLAATSGLGIVLPNNELDEKFFHFVFKDSDNPNTCNFDFTPLYNGSKSTWMVITSKPLAEEEKHLRWYIWGHKQKPDSINLFVKLRPVKYYPDEEMEIMPLYRVSISRRLSVNSYLYLDYPGEVLDGGFYFLIPLNNYCNKTIKDANK